MDVAGFGYFFVTSEKVEILRIMRKSVIIRKSHNLLQKIGFLSFAFFKLSSLIIFAVSATNQSHTFANFVLISFMLQSDVLTKDILPPITKM